MPLKAFCCASGYLFEFAQLLKGCKHSFRLGELEDHKVADFCIEFATKNESANGYLASLATQCANDILDATSFRQSIAKVFFHVGLIGLKPASFQVVQWAVERSEVTSSEIEDDTLCTIHKMFWSALGIQSH